MQPVPVFANDLVMHAYGRNFFVEASGEVHKVDNLHDRNRLGPDLPHGMHGKPCEAIAYPVVDGEIVYLSPRGGSARVETIGCDTAEGAESWFNRLCAKYHATITRHLRFGLPVRS